MEIFMCTSETPWHRGLPTPVQHREAQPIGDRRNGYPGGDLISMRCPVCGMEWEEELP